MATENRMEYDKKSVFGVCEQLGEARVLMELERMPTTFTTREQQAYAWEWIYAQRVSREQDVGEAMKHSARQALWVAVGTAFVALFTAIIAVVGVISMRAS